ncbi:hypothetical protein RB653_010517 [Dictyostelium firmibasis]|uniref:PARP n=1 Tax=Dictyostelium firmibasis TaxID=79012 RepID=A0AAN7TT70_9MYCE
MSVLYSPIRDQTQEIQLHDLDKNSDEYRFVAGNFNKTVSCPVKLIQVVYNKKLWDNYFKQISKSNSSSVHEVFAFHGTRKNDPSLIYTHGLLKERTVGGLYFAANSNTSNGFLHKMVIPPFNNQIFMCRILVPLSQVTSQIHVIKNNLDHYPQYLISY